jgi:ribosome-binding protein aMBF1 (putative translation factor)
MNENIRPYNEIDNYIATFSEKERQEYAVAETALDLASMLYHLRQEQGLTQREAAERSRLKQQAISRLEKAASTIQLDTLQRYLGALGYHIEISVIDNRTGNVAGKTSLSHAFEFK